MDSEQILLNLILQRFIQCLTLLMRFRRRSRRTWMQTTLNSSHLDSIGYAVIDSEENRRRRFWMKNRSEDFWITTVLKDYEDDDWIETFRMNRQLFMSLVDELRPALQPAFAILKSREPVSPEKQTAIALYFLSSTSEYRTVGNLFGVHKSTVLRCVHRVVNAICTRLITQWIQMPDEDECRRISMENLNKYKIPRIIGAIDGSHVAMTPPSDGYHDYVNRKGWPSIVLQAVVDNRFMFRNIYVGCPGSSHDAWVFKASNLFRNTSELIPQSTEIIQNVAVPYLIIGDPAYPLLPWLIKGYPGSGNMNADDRKFTERLSASRVSVEIAFGRLKARWRCLFKRLEVHHTLAINIISACVVLHNIVEFHGLSVPDDWQAASDNNKALYPQPENMEPADNDINPSGIAVRTALKEYSSLLH